MRNEELRMRNEKGEYRNIGYAIFKVEVEGNCK